MALVSSHLLDDPLTNPADDLLDRGDFASSLASLIDNTPSGQSVRFGVYGEWGEGKSTVMQFVRTLLKAKGHRTVFYSPWSAQSVEDAWYLFIQDVAAELNIGTASITVPRAAGKGFRALKGLLGTNPKTKALEAVAEPIAGASDWVGKKARSFVLNEAREALGSQKMTVFVEDLDRVEPRLIPHLLMGFRETLNVKGFNYVLAISPSIITQGLRLGGYQSPNAPRRFLEKIIEYPNYLPRMTAEGRERLIEVAVKASGGAIRSSAFSALETVLPTNPRRLKLLLRHLAALRECFDRLDDDEVNWPLLYAAILLRLEFPKSARELAADKARIAEISYRRMRQHSLSKSSTPQEPETPHSRLSKRQAAIEQLLAELCWNPRRYDLEAVLRFVDAPPVITWKERVGLFEQLTTQPSEAQEAILTNWITASSSATSRPRITMRARALFVALLELRDGILDVAEDADSQAAALKQLEAASGLLAILDLFDSKLDFVASGILNWQSWMDLHSFVGKWSRFHKDPVFQDARASERAILKRWADHLPADSIAGVAQAFLQSHDPLPDLDPRFVALSKEIEERFANELAHQLVSLFSTPGELRSLRRKDITERGRELMFDPDSPFHSPSIRAELEAIASRAPNDPEVQDNFLEYFDQIVSGAFRRPGSLLPSDPCSRLLKDAAFLKMTWTAATAQPLVMRTAIPLLGTRKQIRLELGMPPAAMPIPHSWHNIPAAYPQLAEAVAELNIG